MDKLKPMAARAKTLTFDNGKEFTAHAHIDDQLQSTAYFARPFASWERGSNENLKGLLPNTFQRNELCLKLQMRKLE